LSLDDYGVETPAVIRAPARDRHHSQLRACPECGQPVGEPTTLPVAAPDIVEDVNVAQFVTRAYRCNAHAYPVILPVPVAENARQLGDSWTTVRIRFTDQVARPVAVPKSVVVES
jgi:hypothetical protein